MAASDARPVARKNTAFRTTFPLLDADGDLVTGATGLDSEVSIDGGTFADCASEAVEIATASGMYYLDLTAAEMNGDTVAIIVKTSTVGAKTTPIVLYPEESGDIRADAVLIGGVSTVMSDISAVPAITSSFVVALNWLFCLHRNKRAQTATTETVYKDDANTALATSTKSDDGVTFVRNEYS